MTAIVTSILLAVLPMANDYGSADAAAEALTPGVAVASEGAARMDPPSTTTTSTAVPQDYGIPPFDGTYANGTCTGAIPLLEYLSPGWDSWRMARIMYRESRCDPAAKNSRSSATGLLQILSSHCPWLAAQLDTWCTRSRLQDPHFNVAAAARLWREQGYGAWSTS